MISTQANSNKIILSLFDYTGNWSAPYKEAGYTVIQHDLKLGIDVMKYDYSQLKNIYGILAAVPCTRFCIGSSIHWKKYDETGKTKEAIELAKKTLEIIDLLKPKFWVIENPVGRIQELIPELKKWRLYSFEPYQFGDPYTKATELYGHFCPLLVRNVIKPVRATKNETSIDLHYKLSGKSFKERQTFRDITPKGFAKAFFQANP